MILFGFYIERERILDKINKSHKLQLQIIFTGFIIGLGTFLLREYLIPLWKGTPLIFTQRLLLRFLWWLCAWGQAACYTALMFLHLYKKFWRDLLLSLSTVGRMALAGNR